MSSLEWLTARAWSTAVRLGCLVAATMSGSSWACANRDGLDLPFGFSVLSARWAGPQQSQNDRSPFSLRAALEAEWSPQWSACADRSEWARDLFSDEPADERALRTTCPGDERIDALFEYAHRRRLAAAFTAAPDSLGVVTWPSGSPAALLEELRSAQAATHDPWLRQRYAFLRVRVSFFTHTPTETLALWSSVEKELAAPSRILWSLARSYHAGALERAGQREQANAELEWLFAEGSEFAVARHSPLSLPDGQQARVFGFKGFATSCRREDLEHHFRTTPRSEWLFQCALPATLNSEQDPQLEPLLRRIAAAPTTRHPHRFWLLAASMAAWRGDAAAVEKDLHQVRGSFTEAQRAVIDGASRGVRALAVVAALPRTLDFKATAAALEGLDSSTSPRLEQLILSAFIKRHRGTMVSADPRLGATSASIRALQTRLDRDADFAAVVTGLRLNSQGSPSDLVFSLLAERRMVEVAAVQNLGAAAGFIRPNRVVEIVQPFGSEATRVRNELPCPGGSTSVSCLVTLEAARQKLNRGPARAALTFQQVALIAELGELRSLHARYPQRWASQLATSVLPLLEEVVTTSSDKEQCAQAAFLGAQLTLSAERRSPAWYRRIEADTEYERLVLRECSYYRSWKNKP